MRIFASWSGQPSREVAVLLKNWIPNVLQEVDVYVSSQDIAKGERWLHNVNDNLQDHDFGFSILTPNNVSAPWILFEAGALAKSLKSRLVPLLCGLNTIDLPNHPLTQFQYVLVPEHDEMLRLLSDVNAACARPLPDERLKATFEKWYPDFQAAYKQIDLTSKRKVKPDVDQAPAELVAQGLSDLRREMRDLRAELRAGSADARKAADSRYTIFLDDEVGKHFLFRSPPGADSTPGRWFQSKLIKDKDDPEPA